MRVRSLRYFAGPVSMLRDKVQWPQWGQPPSQLDSNKSCNVYSLACTGLSVLVCTGLSIPILVCTGLSVLVCTGLSIPILYTGLYWSVLAVLQDRVRAGPDLDIINIWTNNYLQLSGLTRLELG